MRLLMLSAKWTISGPPGFIGVPLARRRQRPSLNSQQVGPNSVKIQPRAWPRSTPQRATSLTANSILCPYSASLPELPMQVPFKLFPTLPRSASKIGRPGLPGATISSLPPPLPPPRPEWRVMTSMK